MWYILEEDKVLQSLEIKIQDELKKIMESPENATISGIRQILKYCFDIYVC